mgnify:CR=1 FL=1
MTKFIAAMDHSGGSTGGVLERYGREFTEDNKMQRVHEMRLRMVNSPAFNSTNIASAILYKDTVDRGMVSVLRKKGISPFLKVDSGCEDDGTLKPFSVSYMCKFARDHNIIGTKMRSIVKTADVLEEVVRQQFTLAQAIAYEGLIPIVEPEIPIDHPDKIYLEEMLKKEIAKHLSLFDKSLILKLTIPEVKNHYTSLLMYNGVAKIVGLSGGYTTAEACSRLSKQDGMSASFSRALSEGLFHEQSKNAFDSRIAGNIMMIKEACA